MFADRFFRRLLLCATLVCLGSPSLRAALGVSSLFPGNAAAGVCIDTPLQVTFDAVPTVGTSGRIIVTNSGGAVVDTIDLSSATQTRTIGGTVYNFRPVIVVGNTAIITLRTAVLAYGQTYRVTVEGGALRDASGAAFAGIGAGAWSFSTKSAGPAAGASSLTVAADGSGDFASVQGAFDFVPVNNSKPVLINLRNGTYHEILLLRNRPFVTLRGEDRRQTVITYANNANFNSGNNRAMVGIDSNDFTLERLTLRNSTPIGGSQAEALRTNSTRCFVSNCDFSSYQDTLLINGAVYFSNCYIEGDVDFIWGSGVAYFYRCETRALRRGYNVQSRSTAGRYGFIFVECAVNAADGVTNHVLARTDTTSFPNCEVVLLDCVLGPHITAAGWLVTGTGGTAGLRFLEYRSKNLTGGMIDTSQRAAGSRQMTEAEAEFYRLPANVLGGWTPPVSTDTSSPAGLVTASPAGSSTRLVSLAVRSFAGAGEQTLIAGFGLSGSGTKDVLIRGIGPTLAEFGVSGALADPSLKFQQGTAVLAENDNWGNAPALLAASQLVGAFALAAATKDAALLASVGAASYSAQINSADTGVGLIEVYDAATANRNLGLSSLAARTVLAADDVLIAGFVLSGTGNRLVLIRAVGPTLTEFGLGGVLSDPRIEVFGASGKIYENDNWTAEIGPVVARVGAFTLPAGSKDAALLVSLAPGSYSVQVRGPAGVGGVVLVELYDVP
jgi:pectin methylesterase-like acyl-CoA thioesterase